MYILGATLSVNPSVPEGLGSMMKCIRTHGKKLISGRVSRSMKRPRNRILLLISSPPVKDGTSAQYGRRKLGLGHKNIDQY